VVTGIRVPVQHAGTAVTDALQWGPVVVTGIRRIGDLFREQVNSASMGSGRGDRNQDIKQMVANFESSRFNGVRSW